MLAAMTEWLVMALVTALAATLDFWRLSASGYGNEYYAAAVRSMAQNWRAFFFVAYDAHGFVSVDKPPVGLWLQVASVKLLGYSGFSLIAPEALAGVLAVIALWRVTRRAFGAAAGVLAALALALTPVSVVANRDNILEPALSLTLILAAWALLRALERGAWRWLLLCAVLVGLGFNIKMLEAYLVIPALALLYLLRARATLRARLVRLALAGALLLTVSFAWVAAVDMTPASQRPYVDSTITDSELELALGYNGFSRLLSGYVSSASHELTGRPRAAQRVMPLPPRLARRPAPDAIPSPAGRAGPWRLAQPELGSQVSWLLPLALVGWIALVVRLPRDAEDDETVARRRSGALLWVAWLATGAAVFSFAGFINPYYVDILAPAISALAGGGAARLWLAYRRPGWPGYALPLALALTGAQQAYLTRAAPGWGPGWLATALTGGALAVALALLAWRALASLRPRSDWMRASGQWAFSALAAVALGLALAMPLAWSEASLTWGNEGGWPVAGPAFAHAQSTPGGLVDMKFLRYLEAHRGHSAFLVATVSAYAASPLIIVSGQPVMALGGFSGSDPMLTPGALARLVARGDVNMFLVSSSNVTPEQHALLFPGGAGPAARRISVGAFAPARYTNALTRWVSASCDPIPPEDWNSASYSEYRLGAWELFGCW